MWGVAAVIGLQARRPADRPLRASAGDRHEPVGAGVCVPKSLDERLFLSPATARAPILLAIVVWGVSAWSFFPAQQARLIGIGREGGAGRPLAECIVPVPRLFDRRGSRLADIVHASPLALGWVGASCVTAARVLVIAATTGGGSRRGTAGVRRVARLTLEAKRRLPMSKTTPNRTRRSFSKPSTRSSTSATTPPPNAIWSDRYIQHSAHIAPGRDGLFDLVRTLPDTLRYENQLIVAEGDYVITHGRFSGMAGPPPGSPPTSSASKTASSPSTGTSSRTRRPRQNPSAACRCSARRSPNPMIDPHSPPEPLHCH